MVLAAARMTWPFIDRLRPTDLPLSCPGCRIPFAENPAVAITRLWTPVKRGKWSHAVANGDRYQCSVCEVQFSVGSSGVFKVHGEPARTPAGARADDAPNEEPPPQMPPPIKRSWA